MKNNANSETQNKKKKQSRKSRKKANRLDQSYESESTSTQLKNEGTSPQENSSAMNFPSENNSSLSESESKEVSNTFSPVSHQKVIDGKLSSKAIKIYSADKREYIKQSFDKNHLMYSGQFYEENFNFKIHCNGSLLTSDTDNFVARVTINEAKQINISKSFKSVKRQLFEKLTITKVLQDNLWEQRNLTYHNLEKLLIFKSDKTTTDLQCAEDVFQLYYVLVKHNINLELILNEIVNNHFISCELRNTSKTLLQFETNLCARNKKLPKFDECALVKINFFGELLYIYTMAVRNHKKFLASCFKVSNTIRLTETQPFYLINKDANLFTELVNASTDEVYLKYFDYLQESLFKKVANMSNQKSLRSALPLTHPLYFYLFKSFQELVVEISNKTKLTINDLFYVDKDQWKLAENINWPSSSGLNQTIEQQYYFIFKLMNQYAPGAYSNKLKLEYTFKLLPNENDKSWRHRLMNWMWQTDKSSDLPEGRIIWIIIFDDAIHALFSKNKVKYSLFEPLILGHMNFIRTEKDNYESFRIATHNIIRFIALTIEKVKGNSKSILTEQIETIWKSFGSNNPSGDFRELVDVYNTYWEFTETIIEKIVDKFPYGPFKRDMETIRQDLYDISTSALGIEATTQELVTFSRSYNDFLDDLYGVEFRWFTKKNLPGCDVINEEKQSYEIMNPDGFMNAHGDRPRHYIIEIIKDLLKIVIQFLQESKWTKTHTMMAASDLLSTIRKSFCYLKEQPDYVSFDLFKNERTQPFASAVENCITYDDFQKRINTIGESFWYLRKQDEIDIEQAVELYNEVNKNAMEEQLKDCYMKYLNKFNSFIEDTLNMSSEDKIAFIVNQVTQNLNENNLIKNIKLNEISSTLRANIFPEILAGLAAVWSIQESKDASSGKSFKPHCIQVLCILRLLNVDNNSNGIDKHLAQVLTGQGKSLVLGLLSSLLALLGYKVRIVCYSKYLATRDQRDFLIFFDNVGICDQITYSTFEEMADEVLNPEINGKKQSLRDLVENLVLHKDELKGQIQINDVSNTVLLIDEVDVFFSDLFYGNVYRACTTPKLESLYNVQEKIWEMACSHYNHSTILSEVRKIDEFNKIGFSSTSYNILKGVNGQYVIRCYNTASLYEEELSKMISNAIDVASGKNCFINDFKLDDKGVISMRKKDGEYSSCQIRDYYNIFHYFRLKSKPYDQSNYGYLFLHCGAVSYAKLPEKYPLILGVSGTLSTLSVHEKRAVECYYKINKQSFMPSFFGSSHLQFCTTKDFHVLDTEEQWLTTVFNHTTSKLRSGRSVLIFVDTDVEINKFQAKYGEYCDRLHILTENTNEDDKKKYIDDASIAKTITLATRGMGRGVDYKTSVTVEKNGGVHVIQTFFSVDIKEETQIKGRTARKDNKGSYELILCTTHLIAAGFWNNNVPLCYGNLHLAREQLVSEKGLKKAQQIKDVEEDHKTTMDYFESLLKKKRRISFDTII